MDPHQADAFLVAGDEVERKTAFRFEHEDYEAPCLCLPQRAPAVWDVPELPGMLLDHSANLNPFSLLFLGWKCEKEGFSRTP